MPGVFLSYRRPETDYAVLLYAWLAERFGTPHVFWDREDIDGEGLSQGALGAAARLRGARRPHRASVDSVAVDPEGNPRCAATEDSGAPGPRRRDVESST